MLLVQSENLLKNRSNIRNLVDHVQKLKQNYESFVIGIIVEALDWNPIGQLIDKAVAIVVNENSPCQVCSQRT